MGFLDFLFPKFCAGCNRPAGYLCANCRLQITQKPLICPICFRPSIGGLTHPLCTRKYGPDGLWSLASYNEPMRQLIHKLKYRFVKDTAQILIDLLLEYWASHPNVLIDLLKKTHGQNWQIIPVPLHKKRQNWRGFNQSNLFATILSEKLSIPLNDCLIRPLNTKPQFQLNRQARLQNTRHAFDLAPKHQHLTANIILIDDVWTTGATLRSCAQVLKRAGVERVWIVTIAR